MTRFLEMKKKHPDAIILFRVGDFYETFMQDAVDTSKILGITLTRRAANTKESVELTGFPHHACENYLPKLVRAGRRVAICEPLEDPELKTKSEKTGPTELITPSAEAIRKAEEKERMELFRILTGALFEFLAFLFNFSRLDYLTREFIKSASSLGVSPRKSFDYFYQKAFNQPSLFP